MLSRVIVLLTRIVRDSPDLSPRENGHAEIIGMVEAYRLLAIGRGRQSHSMSMFALRRVLGVFHVDEMAWMMRVWLAGEVENCGVVRFAFVVFLVFLPFCL